MKGLHKKIGVGVLVSGLLIGGINFSSRSVAHASSNNNDDSLFAQLIIAYKDLKLPLPPELDAYSKGGHRGLLDFYYDESSLKNIWQKVKDSDYRDIWGSILAYRSSGNYSVIGVKVENKPHSILDYGKYWDNKDCKLIDVNFNGFLNAVRDKDYKQRKEKLKKLGLKNNCIYKVRFDGKYEFLIIFF